MQVKRRRRSRLQHLFALSDQLLSLRPTDAGFPPGLDAAGVCLPAGAVGGDFYAALSGPGNRVRLVIADVMGKGGAAAVQMLMARAACRAANAGAASPAELLARVNHGLVEDLRRVGSFLTMCCVEYDPVTGELACATGGHPHPLVHRAGTGEMAPWQQRGMLLGVNPDAEYLDETLALRPGDTVLLYTDGVADLPDAQGAPLGRAGLARWLAARHDGDLDQLRQQLIAFLDSRGVPDPRRDDLTVVLLRHT